MQKFRSKHSGPLSRRQQVGLTVTLRGIKNQLLLRGVLRNAQRPLTLNDSREAGENGSGLKAFFLHFHGVHRIEREAGMRSLVCGLLYRI